MKNIKRTLSTASVFFVLVMLFTVFSSFFEYILEPNKEISKLIYFSDIIVSFIILADLIYEFTKAKKKMEFFKKTWIAIIAILPLFIFWEDLYFLNRILRFVLIFFVIKDLGDTSKGKYNPLLSSALIGFVIIIVCCILILYFETAPDSNIKTALDAVYWAVVSVATVGYGDLYPVTDGGKIYSVDIYRSRSVCIYNNKLSWSNCKKQRKIGIFLG